MAYNSDNQFGNLRNRLNVRADSKKNKLPTEPLEESGVEEDLPEEEDIKSSSTPIGTFRPDFKNTEKSQEPDKPETSFSMEGWNEEEIPDEDYGSSVESAMKKAFEEYPGGIQLNDESSAEEDGRYTEIKNDSESQEEEEEELSETAEIERQLIAGVSREELVAAGHNYNTVRTVYSILKGKGLVKPSKTTAVAKSKKKAPEEQGNQSIQVFSKGSPPEAIISAIRIPDVTNGGSVPFEQGMKFGLSIAVLGIRMAQDLSALGVSQAKPLLDMAKSMREGEAVAAKNAASDAAMEAAGMVQQSLMPVLSNIQRSSPTEAGDPMKQMMVKTMEPIFQQLIGNVMGRLSHTQQAQQQVSPSPSEGVSGWTHRVEEG